MENKNQLLLHEAIINYLAEVATGNLSLTVQQIEEEPDSSLRELYFGLICLHEDLQLQRTENAKLSNSLHNILESLSDLLIIVNVHGMITLINTQTSRFFGVHSSHILGKNIRQLLHSNHLAIRNIFPKDTELHKHAFDYEACIQLIRNQQFVDINAQLHPLPTSTWTHEIPILLSANIMQDMDGQHHQIIFTLKDGRQSKLLQELQEKQAQLLQTSKLASMGELSSGIAHELNNPLFAVAGLTEVIQRKLQRKYPDAYTEVEKSIQDILFATNRMQKIIHHMRIFSRQEKIELQEDDVHEIILDALLLIREQLRVQNIQLELQFSSLPLRINCAKNRVEQVLLNLLSNAKDSIVTKRERTEKFMGVITIQTTNENNQVVIHVTDNGIGISTEDQNKIFDPFFSTKEVGKGTGLGLSISYGIMQEHMGKISINSVLNEFTTFSLSFPQIIG